MFDTVPTLTGERGRAKLTELRIAKSVAVALQQPHVDERHQQPAATGRMNLDACGDLVSAHRPVSQRFEHTKVVRCLKNLRVQDSQRPAPFE
jgi:hypothetical protein